MGCLLEAFFEIVFEVIVEAVWTIYMKLMTLFVPAHRFDERQRKRIKNGVTVFAVLLLLCALVGFFMFLQPPSVTKTVGAYLLFVPLGIMSVQIVAGIVYRIVKAIRKRR